MVLLYHLQDFLVCIISLCYSMSITAFPRDLSLKYRWLMNPLGVMETFWILGFVVWSLPWLTFGCYYTENLFSTLCLVNVHMYIRATDCVRMTPNTFLSQKITISTMLGRTKISSESQSINEVRTIEASVLRNSVLRSACFNMWNMVQIL